MPSSASTRCAAASWPLPPSISTRSGQGPSVSPSRRASRGRGPASFSSRAEAAAHHLAHHAVVVARRDVLGADVELAVVVLGEAFRPGDDHRADRVRAHDVAVVVDLDAARRLRQAEDARRGRRGAAPGSTSRRACGQRLARIGQRVLDQLALLAALRHGDLDVVPGALAERRRQQLALLEIGRDEDQPRHRLVVVELRQERLEHARRVEALVGLREIGAVAPVLAGAEEEDLDAGQPAVLVRRRRRRPPRRPAG